jgi:hypothetical protein
MTPAMEASNHNNPRIFDTVEQPVREPMNSSPSQSLSHDRIMQGCVGDRLNGRDYRLREALPKFRANAFVPG